MLATKEICKVRSDAVGGKTKAYAYAIVERNNKASARVIVLDAKRGDIGSTSAAYAEAAFGVLGAAAVTVSPYLGHDGVAGRSPGCGPKGGRWPRSCKIRPRVCFVIGCTAQLVL